MEKISGVVITFNEESRIEDCLKSLQNFCDEIIVVDSFSTDATIKIASKYTSRIYQRKPDTIIGQINYATSLANNEWVFCLDADERISPELLNEIIKEKKSGLDADAYRIYRLNYYINGYFKYCGWYPDAKIRLFKRSKGNWGGDEPHYRVIVEQASRVKTIKRDIIHFTYKDLTHQIEKMNRFSSQWAKCRSGGNSYSILFHLIFNPLIKFIRCYVFQGGFLAGSRGLINSVINSFYVFSKYAKLWEMENSKPAGSDEK